MSQPRTRSGESGIALLHALLLMTTITVLTGGAAMLARVEVFVSRHHREEREALYAAQAMLAATLQDLERAPQWRDVLSGSRRAAFADGAADAPRQIPGGGTVRVCCGAGTLTGRVQSETGVAWRPFGWQSLGELLDVPAVHRYYLIAWVVDDAEDADGDPSGDSNGRLIVRAEAVTPLGVRRAVEAAVERGPPDPASGVYSPGLQLLTWRELR